MTFDLSIILSADILRTALVVTFMNERTSHMWINVTMQIFRETCALMIRLTSTSETDPVPRTSKLS